MGGNSLLMKPLPLFVSEFAYSSVLKALDVDKLPPEQHVQALMDVPAEEYLTKITPAIPLTPVLDGDIITSNVTYAQWGDKEVARQLPGLKWCDSILIGDCQFDVS
jgi:hypothetical protein